MRRYAVIAILGVLGAALHAQGRLPDLDTRFIGRPDPGERQSGKIRSPRPIFYKSPVSARLVSIDRTECSWNEKVVYDVELTNNERQTIALPWSAFSARTPPSGESPDVFRFMVLSLSVGEGMGGSLGWVEALEGSVDEPGSFRRLPPGESVVIRVSTPCQLTNSKAGPMIAPTGTISLKVFARVHLARTDDEIGAFAESNTVPITVSR